MKRNVSTRPQTASESKKRTKLLAPSSKSEGGEPKKSRMCNVNVVVRARPPSESENVMNNPQVVSTIGMSEVALRYKSTRRLFTFDRVYSTYSTQEEIYNFSVKPLVDEVLSGFNCTVFAYGQTGTGKTHTMEGELNDKVLTKRAGVIPRSVHTIFTELNKRSQEFSVKVSFLELYNEELSDLLGVVTDDDPSSKNSNAPPEKEVGLKMFETDGKGLTIMGLEEVIVNNVEEVFQLLQKAQAQRKTAETLMNKNSSRSHCVFTITIHTKETTTDGEDIIKTGKLHLVDLAGSECVGRSGATDARAKEAGNINKSLLTLGRVINALVDRLPYVPYRDSKLTRLLQESLGGKSKTCIIATVSPCQVSLDETMNTLDYAHRAKNIKNRPQVNKVSTRSAYMKELLAEIQGLKRENEVLRTRNGVIVPPEQWENMQTENKIQKSNIQELERVLQSKMGELDEVAALYETLEKDHNRINEENKVMQARLAEINIILEQKEKEAQEAAKTIEGQHFIISAYQNTEKKLQKHTSDLQNTLQVVIEEKNRVHASSERIVNIHKANLDSKDAMIQQYNVKFDQFCSHAEEFSAQYNSILQNMNIRNDEFKLAKNEQIEKIKVSVEQVQAFFTEKMKSFVAHDKEETEKIINIFLADLASFQATTIQQEEKASQMYMTNFQTHMDDIKERLSNTSSILEDWNTNCMVNFEKEKSTLNEFVTEQRNSLQILQNVLAEESKVSVANVNEHSQFLKEFEKSQQIQSNEMVTNLLSGIQCLVSQFQSTQQMEIEKAVSTMQQKLSDGAKQFKQSENKFLQTIDIASKDIQDWSQVRQEKVQEATIFTSELFEKSKESNEFAINGCETLNIQMKENARNADKTRSTGMLSFRNMLDKQTEVINTNHTKHTEYFNDASNNLQDVLKSVCLPAIKSTWNVCEQFHVSSKQSVEEVTQSVMLHEQTNLESVTDTKEYVKSYAMSLKINQPSGQTPIKKQYSYSKNIAKTEAQDILLERCFGVNGNVVESLANDTDTEEITEESISQVEMNDIEIEVLEEVIVENEENIAPTKETVEEPTKELHVTEEVTSKAALKDVSLLANNASISGITRRSRRTLRKPVSYK